MKLQYMHVYDVSQQRTSAEPAPPKGGHCKKLTEEFVNSLESYSKGQAIEQRPEIDFIESPQAAKPNAIRQLVMQYAFEPKSAANAAFQLAERLSHQMDDRTKRLLFLLTLHSNDGKQRVTMWAFPKDEPIQFEADDLTLSEVKNAFSKRAGISKCARFEGKKTEDAFRRGYVIDGSSSASAGPALYWTNGFLQGQLALTSVQGTLQLSDTLTRVFKRCDSLAERSEVSEAVIAIREEKDRTWSFQDVADKLLSDANRQRFLEAAPKKERKTKFPIDPKVFAKQLGLHVYMTDDNVMVATPFEPLKNTTLVVDEGRIKLDGKVESESIDKQRRSRSGRA